jgi:hypothetical protein
MWNPFRKPETKDLKITAEPKYNRDAICSAVYRVLNARLTHYNDLIIWLSHNYDVTSWGPRLEQSQKDIDAIRRWAEALPRTPVRSEYLHWLDYYERGLNEAWKELRTQDHKKEMDHYDRESREKYDASLDLDIPKP